MLPSLINLGPLTLLGANPGPRYPKCPIKILYRIPNNKLGKWYDLYWSAQNRTVSEVERNKISKTLKQQIAPKDNKVKILLAAALNQTTEFAYLSCKLSSSRERGRFNSLVTDLVENNLISLDNGILSITEYGTQALSVLSRGEIYRLPQP